MRASPKRPKDCTERRPIGAGKGTGEEKSDGKRRGVEHFLLNASKKGKDQRRGRDKKKEQGKWPQGDNSGLRKETIRSITIKKPNGIGWKGMGMGNVPFGHKGKTCGTLRSHHCGLQAAIKKQKRQKEERQSGT